jgi:hypothetical protein
VKPDDSAEMIQKRMAELRRELDCDVRDVGRGARKLANPLYYVRNFPWASAAAAAAVGYLLVPKKKPVISSDPKVLAELVRQQQVRLDATKSAGDSQGLLASLAVMGLTWAARAGLSYLGQRLASAAMNRAREESHPPEPSPLDEPRNTPR